MINVQHEFWMQLVYEEVELAIQEGNPPSAALITDQKDRLLSITHNQANTKNFKLAHAEMEAIHLACAYLGLSQISGCRLYVNAESCAMCAGAIIKSGITHVYYGAPYEEGSNPKIYLREINERACPKLNIQGGLMEERFLKQIRRGRAHLLRNH